jgi:polyhydroxyalkanoate synthesis regulator phasin
MASSDDIGLAAGIAAVASLTVRQVVAHLLGRGKLRNDEATIIRAELRAEIARKDKSIDSLEQRVATLEEELDKVEHERNALDVAMSKYKVDVYRTLVEAGVNRELLNAVLALK